MPSEAEKLAHSSFPFGVIILTRGPSILSLEYEVTYQISGTLTYMAPYNSYLTPMLAG